MTISDTHGEGLASELTPERYVADFISHGEQSVIPLPAWEQPYQDAGVIEMAERLGYIWIGRNVGCDVSVTPHGRTAAKLHHALSIASDTAGPEAVAWAHWIHIPGGKAIPVYIGTDKQLADEVRKEGKDVFALYATPPAPQPALALIEAARDLAKTYRTTGSFSTGMEYVRPIMSRLLAALSEQGEAAQPAAKWVAVDEIGNDNFATSIYENDYDGLLIARCNQNGNYPWQAASIIRGLERNKPLPASPGIASQAEEGSGESGE